MQPTALLLGLSALLASPILSAAEFVGTGDCGSNMEYRYKYEVKQSHFEEGNKQTMMISCFVTVTCEEAGKYGDKEARLYNMVVTDTRTSGDMFEKEPDDVPDLKNVDIYRDNFAPDDLRAPDGVRAPENEVEVEIGETNVKTFDDAVKGWFKFVQTQDGSVPAVYHANDEDSDIVNFKKAIAAAFQANFEGTSTKMESDPQSLHLAQYTYAERKQDDVVRMHRTVTTAAVEDFAIHIPKDEVDVLREEDIEYTGGVLSHAAGVTTTKILLQEGTSEEVDSLEAILQKRNADMSEYMNDFFYESEPESEDESAVASQADLFVAQPIVDLGEDEENVPTFDSQTDLPDFDAQGTYTMDLVSQRRMLRRERRAAVNHLELPEAMESTLMAHVDHTLKDMQRMITLRSQLDDIHHVLDVINNDPSEGTSLANKIEELLYLEASYGPLTGYVPAIDIIIEYLEKLVGSVDVHDREMRALLYFMLSRDGSSHAQKTLLAAMDSAVDEEEKRAVTVYIAFTENPQPEMVSELEDRMGNDTHSADPLLLAYGALVAKATPDLQQRMILFLLSRLPQAETSSSSLIHHILSLGNTESNQVTSSLTDYLQHPDHHVQLSSIYALRYATSDSLVQKALTALLNQPQVSDEHLATVLQCLLYGIEHASNTHAQTPFSVDLATALSSSVMNTDNEELQQALVRYLHLVNSAESLNLIKLMTAPESKGYSNSTRLRRGSYWASSKSVYNLVSPLATRRKDMQNYPYRKAYIWGKKFGVKKGNVQIAAGGFIGAATGGKYKIFGRAKAVGHAFGRTKTAVDILVHREKTGSSTRTRLYGQIIGKTLVNINDKSSTTCKRYSRPFLNSKRYKLFNLRISIFIYVGTLEFNLAGYVRLSSDLYVEFCQRGLGLSAEAGLVTTVTMELEAGATAKLLKVARGGITVTARFNYKLTPELSTEVCYQNSKIRVKNCIGIYHEWKNNRIVLDVWYQLRKVKWCKKWGVRYPCGITWGKRRKWNALSTAWNLPGRSKRALYKRCDSNISCSSVTAQDAGPTIMFPDYTMPPPLTEGTK